MTEINNTTKSPISKELSKRLVENYHFSSIFLDSFSDHVHGLEKPVPIHLSMYASLLDSLSLTLHELLEELYAVYPENFPDYTSKAQIEAAFDDAYSNSSSVSTTH